MKKKALSLALCAALAASILPAALVMADDAKPYEGVTLSFWAGNAEYNEGTMAVL